MRQTKYRIEQFQFYNQAGVEQRLADMAQKGWFLEKTGTFFWKYRRGEPETRTYAITYFPDASDFDPAPTPGQETYRDFCQASGWEFVTQWAQMQIFSTSRPHPVPIETDEAVRLETTHRAMRKNYIPGSVAMILLSVLQIGMQGNSLLRDPVDWLSSGLNLCMVALWPLLLGYYLMSLLGYWLWLRRSRQSVAQGGPCAENPRWLRVLSNLVLALTILILPCTLWAVKESAALWGMCVGVGVMTLILAVTLGLKALLKRRGVSRRKNQAATMLACVLLPLALGAGALFLIFAGIRVGWFQRNPVEIYHAGGWDWKIYRDELPLTVEDLTETDYPHYSYEWKEQSTPLVFYGEGRQNGFPDRQNPPELEYEIAEVKVPALYDLCLNNWLNRYAYDDYNGREYRPIDEPLWQADAVYRLYWDGEAMEEYIVCWGGRLVQFHSSWELTPGQIALAAERLRD